MSKTRRLQVVVTLLLVLAVTAITARWFFSAERRRTLWTHEAIAEIARLCVNESTVAQKAATIQNAKPSDSQPGFWIADNLAVMHDGQWIVFKNECIHRQQLLGDIFIGKASNGRWYYSSFHVCCDMLVPTMDGQPADLPSFIGKYYLKEFNGDADSKEAIEQTWDAGSTPIR